MMIGRFLAVGLACALLHNVILIAGDRAGLHYAASSFVFIADRWALRAGGGRA